LPGGVCLDQLIGEWESDPAMAAELSHARKRLATEFDEIETLRSLRMKAGLSQALLAVKAGTTQPQIALIESGARDPQTNMILRLAAALGVPAERAFAAITAQRALRKQSDE
jgi:Predicted transcriptional regulator with C-terminal CBS domains